MQGHSAWRAIISTLPSLGSSRAKPRRTFPAVGLLFRRRFAALGCLLLVLLLPRLQCSPE